MNHNNGNTNVSSTTTDTTSTAELCGQAVPWNPAQYDGDDANIDDPDVQERIRSDARLALEKFGALEGLNESQRLAVEGASNAMGA